MAQRGRRAACAGTRNSSSRFVSPPAADYVYRPHLIPPVNAEYYERGESFLVISPLQSCN
jgi:hypothetical protein